jgi:hypothetical protein
MGEAVLATTLGGALGLQIYQGEQSRKAGVRAERRQEAAQNKAESAAAAARNQAEADVARANRKKPDIAALLAAAQSGASLGSASTLLTSGRQARPKLATPTLLGE